MFRQCQSWFRVGNQSSSVTSTIMKGHAPVATQFMQPPLDFVWERANRNSGVGELRLVTVPKQNCALCRKPLLLALTARAHVLHLLHSIATIFRFHFAQSSVFAAFLRWTLVMWFFFKLIVATSLLFVAFVTYLNNFGSIAEGEFLKMKQLENKAQRTSAKLFLLTPDRAFDILERRKVDRCRWRVLW